MKYLGRTRIFTFIKTTLICVVLASCSGDAGKTGDSGAQLISTTPQKPNVFFSLSAINSTNEADYELSGTCTNANSIKIVLNSQSYTTDCSSKKFKTNIDLSALTNANYSVQVSAINEDFTITKSQNIVKDTVASATAVNLVALTYTIGETIPIEVSFTSKTAVGQLPPPSLVVMVGTNPRNFFYSAGSGTDTLTFSYRVTSDDNDLDGLNLALNTIQLNGGTISVADTAADIDLAALSNNIASSLVIGTAPSILIDPPDDVTAANEQNYFFTGLCSHDGQNVNLTAGALSFTTLCIGGAWSSGSVDTSSEPDSATFALTAQHELANGATSTLESTSVDKSTTNPIVTINTPETITSANVTEYSLNGSCSESSEIVSVNLDGLIYNPICGASGAWNTGIIDVSTLSDAIGLSITIDHSSAPQVSSTVDKNVILPTVTINNPQNINIQNETNYQISGSCSEDGEAVDISIGSLLSSITCNSGSWQLLSFDTQSLSDAQSISITVDHESGAGTSANQAQAVISKDTLGPAIIDIGESLELINRIDLAWTLINSSGHTLDDYSINYRPKGQSAWQAYDDGLSTDSQTQVNSLNAETIYEFRVKLHYDTSESTAWSSIVEAQTKPNNPLFTENTAMNVGGATDSQVVAFSDNTDIELNGNPLITLDQGETYNFVSTQFDVITADKPIYTAGRIGNTSNNDQSANITWQPTAWAAKSFSFNSTRDNPQLLTIYPIEDGEITVKTGGTLLDSETLTAEAGTTLSWSTYGSYQISSTANILIYHYSNGGGSYTDPKPIMPNALKIIGFPSSSMILTALLDSTNYSATHSDSTIETGNLDKTDAITITPQGTSSLYQSESLLISADKKISGASFADSNGHCSAPFVPIAFMKTHYAINVDSSYVAFASTQSGSISAYDEDDNLISTVNLTRSGADSSAPYKARFTTMDEGTRFISTSPVAGWYHPSVSTGAARDDETVLYGSNL